MGAFTKSDGLDELLIDKVRVLAELESYLVAGFDVLVVFHDDLIAVLEDLNVLCIKDLVDAGVLLKGGEPELRDGGEGKVPLCIEWLSLEGELLFDGKDLVAELIIELKGWHGNISRGVHAQSKDAMDCMTHCIDLGLDHLQVIQHFFDLFGLLGRLSWRSPRGLEDNPWALESRLFRHYLSD